MSSNRFQKAAQLAARSNTWNTNDVAEAINEQLHEERDKQIGTGFGNLLDAWDKADARLQAHKDMVFDNPMLNFLSSVDAGYYPSPDVLVAISKCFSSYLDAQGDKSLDEAFFGQIHGKRKSYAHKFSTEGWSSEYVLFHKWFELENTLPKEKVYGKPEPRVPLPKEKAAEKFLNDNFPDKDVDVDSFLRSYRRWMVKSKISS
jgi:hypothetical protein